jgi:type VI secretion system VasI family protein
MRRLCPAVSDPANRALKGARLGLLIVVIALLAQAKPSGAYDDLADCAVIDDGTKRLACYDELAGRDLRQSKLTPTTGKWVISKTVSDINDRRLILVMLPAENLPNDGISIYAKPSLNLRCEDGQTYAYLAPQRIMSVSNDGLDVLLRIDGSQAKREIWQVSGDGRKIFQPRPIPWIKALMSAEKLEAQIVIYGRDSISLSFDLKGLELAAAPLRALCSW